MQITGPEKTPELRAESEELEDDLMDFASISPAHAAIVLTMKLFDLLGSGLEKVSEYFEHRVQEQCLEGEEGSQPSRINEFVRSYF